MKFPNCKQRLRDSGWPQMATIVCLCIFGTLEQFYNLEIFKLKKNTNFTTVIYKQYIWLIFFTPLRLNFHPHFSKCKVLSWQAVMLLSTDINTEENEDRKTRACKALQKRPLPSRRSTPKSSQIIQHGIEKSQQTTTHPKYIHFPVKDSFFRKW